MISKHFRRAVLDGATGAATPRCAVSASAMLSAASSDPVFDLACKLRPLCEEQNRVNVEQVALFQTLPEHLRVLSPEPYWEIRRLADKVARADDQVEAIGEAIGKIEDMQSWLRARRHEETIRGEPELDRRMDDLCDQKDEIEEKITNTRATSLAGAVAQIALAWSNNEELTGADNKGTRELAEHNKRLLFSAIAVVERAAGVHRDDMISDHYMPEWLNPVTAGAPETPGTGAA